VKKYQLQHMKLTTRKEYEDRNLATRAERMRWWKEARFGMFVHFGLYSILGRHEWAMATECIPKEEYERLTEQFQPRPGAHGRQVSGPRSFKIDFFGFLRRSKKAFLSSRSHSNSSPFSI
jgi:hypothetical protein